MEILAIALGLMAFGYLVAAFARGYLALLAAYLLMAGTSIQIMLIPYLVARVVSELCGTAAGRLLAVKSGQKIQGEAA